MSAICSKFIGHWQGTSSLFLKQHSSSCFESKTELSVNPAVNRRFMEFNYHWQHEEKNQQGVILVGSELKPGELCATWTDTWHQNREIMSCHGLLETEKDLTIEGKYPVEEGPDWHWRIHLQLLSKNELTMTMHNISPEGQEELAVKACYTRNANTTHH